MTRLGTRLLLWDPGHILQLTHLHLMTRRTFMGIGIRNLSVGAELESEATNFADALRQTAVGILGTTVQLADLVRHRHSGSQALQTVDVWTAPGDSIRRRRVYVHRRRGGIAHVCPAFHNCPVASRLMSGLWQIARRQQKRQAGVTRGECASIRLLLSLHVSCSRYVRSEQFAAMFFGVACMFLVA